MIKNQIFQVQNAIFQTLVNANLGVDIITNRGAIVNYPYIILAGTKKKVLAGFQVQTLTEIDIVTKDFSIISSSVILEAVEHSMKIDDLASNIEGYKINDIRVILSETSANSEGFFTGKLLVEVVLN